MSFLRKHASPNVNLPVSIMPGVKFDSKNLLASALFLAALSNHHACASDRLLPDASIRDGGRITSPSGKYNLIMQTDGTLVMYRSDGTIRYSMAKYGKFAVMQNDCNFVEYASNIPDSSKAIWSSGTWNQCPYPGSLIITDSGDLRIEWSNPSGSMGGCVWAIGTDPTPVGYIQYPLQPVLPSAPAPATKPFVYDNTNLINLPFFYGRY